ncbi:MAG TPA: methylated-DNA--[protein]-cysteine S-methyltransferase [Alphaproteobacteria bacterium]|nr:methylated-DNA--[protein]-cysteine S-methyltransferase [Alphaproteobacteria bacterium]
MKRSSTKPVALRIVAWPSTPLGPLWAEVDAKGAVLALQWGRPPKNATVVSVPSLQKSIDAYFKKGASLDKVKIRLEGTPFQQKIWQAVRSIPPGTVMSYGELAHEHHTGPRAVARVLASTVIPLIIPCHRVVAAGGKLGGYGHMGLEHKKWLLQHEGAL